MPVRRLSNSGLSGVVYKNLTSGVTPIPSVPTIGTATAVTDSTATVAFTAGGINTATSYTVRSTPAGSTVTDYTSPITVTGLTELTNYTFTVTANNATGSSAQSAASNQITTPLADQSSMFPIGMVQVGSGGSSSISFTGIPSTYKHLQIRGITQQTSNAGANCIIRYNSDSASNYNSHYLGGNGSAIGAGFYISGSTTGGYAFDSANNGNSAFCVFIIDVLDYANTNKYKTSRSLSGWSNNSNSENLSVMSSAWRNTAAVTSITLQDYNGGSFAQYSSFALYGIKG